MGILLAIFIKDGESTVESGSISSTTYSATSPLTSRGSCIAEQENVFSPHLSSVCFLLVTSLMLVWHRSRCFVKLLALIAISRGSEIFWFHTQSALYYNVLHILVSDELKIMSVCPSCEYRVQLVCYCSPLLLNQQFSSTNKKKTSTQIFFSSANVAVLTNLYKDNTLLNSGLKCIVKHVTEICTE